MSFFWEQQYGCSTLCHQNRIPTILNGISQILYISFQKRVFNTFLIKTRMKTTKEYKKGNQLLIKNFTGWPPIVSRPSTMCCYFYSSSLLCDLNKKKMKNKQETQFMLGQYFFLHLMISIEFWFWIFFILTLWYYHKQYATKRFSV